MDVYGPAGRDRLADPGERLPALVYVDAQGHIAGWGDEAERILGYTAVEAVGRPAADLLSPSLVSPPGRPDWQGTLLLRHRNGGSKRLLASAHAVADGSGGCEWSLSVGEPVPLSPDIEDQALADWVLYRSPVALVVYDQYLRCVRQNAAMRRLTGVHDEVGRSWGELLTGADAAACEGRLRRVLETDRSESDFLIHGRTTGDPDHDHVFSASMSPVRHGDGQVRGVCVTLADITDQYRSRQRLALLNEASTYIGSTLDITRTAQELVELAVPRLADFATVDLLETLLSGGEPLLSCEAGSAVLRRVAHRSVLDGAPESVVTVGQVDVYPVTSPPGRCLATGMSVLNRRMDPAVEKWMTEDPERAAKTDAYGIHSWLHVPVTARGTTLGVVLLARWRQDEPFEQDDLTIAEELVARAAVCLDNARRFTRERTASLTLQRSLLPQKLPELSAVEAASRYLPTERRLGVGGDWFDVIPLSGARVALVVGDVVGHGIRAAAEMGRLRTAVRTLADVELPPDELLTQLDDLVVGLLAESEANEDAGETGAAGATCLYAVYDPVSSHCTIARAGHPAPVIVQPDGSPRWLDIPAGPPLGLGELPFEAVGVHVPEGSLVALYTDGLVASRDRSVDSAVDTLGQVLSTPADSLEDLCDRVVETLLPETPADDAALLLVRPRPLDAAHVATWDLPADPSIVARTRANVARQLEMWGLEDASFVTELVVSELVTNAIRYGAEYIRLRLIRDRTLVCEVSDGSNTAPHLVRARVFDEGGRGLLLVAQLTERWGCRQHARGKTIWCEQLLS
ncbi:SpoIIE family protein phosphatase [Streptomyces sp. NPDC048279]|uniref:SpoIIE family protein phosphatase n=1 Tax=Streptomyces sp. NPDC048279 TaxID=3154714 RepID=UPI0034482BCD